MIDFVKLPIKASIKSAIKSTRWYAKYQKRKEQQHVQQLLKDDDYLRQFIQRKMLSENPLLTKSSQKTHPRYLALKESDGKYDWLKFANEKNGLKIDLSLLLRDIFSGVFQYLLSEYLQTGKSNTIVEFYKPKYQENRKNYLKFCLRALTSLQKLFNFDLLILPKIHDDWIIDFIQAAQTLNIPLLINERETVNTPKRLTVAPHYFKEYVGLHVNRLLVANKGHHEFWLNAGYPPEKIRLTGDIKSDYWHRPDKWQSLKEIHAELCPEKFKILVFSFGKNTYRNYYYGNDLRDWSALNRDFHEILLQIITEHADRVQIIYKTGAKEARDLFSDYDRFIKQVNSLGGNKVFLRLNQHYDTMDLIRESNAIVGFQTTGMIEAMFTDKPIITVGWGELWDETKDTLLPLHQTKALDFAHSPDELFSLLSRSVETADKKIPISPAMQSARQEFREKYFFQPDGQASQRLLMEAEELLKSLKK